MNNIENGKFYSSFPNFLKNVEKIKFLQLKTDFNTEKNPSFVMSTKRNVSFYLKNNYFDFTNQMLKNVFSGSVELSSPKTSRITKIWNIKAEKGIFFHETGSVETHNKKNKDSR